MLALDTWENQPIHVACHGTCIRATRLVFSHMRFSTYPSACAFIRASVCAFVPAPIYLSMSWSVFCQSTRLSINVYILVSRYTHLSIYFSIDPPAYLFIYPSVHSFFLPQAVLILTCLFHSHFLLIYNPSICLSTRLPTVLFFCLLLVHLTI